MFLLLKTNEKVLYFMFLDQKSSIKNIYIYTCNTTDWNVSLFSVIIAYKTFFFITSSTQTWIQNKTKQNRFIKMQDSTFNKDMHLQWMLHQTLISECIYR